MPRELKPHKIEVIWHPNKRENLDLLFDRDKKVFFGRIGMERVEHTDIVEARKLVRALLVRAPSYDWEPLIVATGVDAEYDEERHSFGGQAESRSESVDLDFRFYRCERCKSPLREGEWLSRSHAIDFEDNVSDARMMRRWATWSKGEADEFVAKCRKERAENAHLETFRVNEGDRILDYSDDLWRGLLAIKEAIKSARRQLSALIAKPDLDQRLKAFAAAPLLPMLPASADEPKRKARAR